MHSTDEEMQELLRSLDGSETLEKRLRSFIKKPLFSTHQMLRFSQHDTLAGFLDGF